MRQLTVPVGRIVRYVKLQLNGQNRNQASGGSCNALRGSAKIDTAVLIKKDVSLVVAIIVLLGSLTRKKRTGT
jgi:Na+-transporting NADH:ubiquinone oxidoreductase subunit NqrD